MKILVTGSTGFIGRNLVKKLQENNFNFEGLSRKKINSYYKIHACNICNISQLKKIIIKNRYDCIIHLSGISKNKDNHKIILENFIQTVNLAESCKNGSVKKIIFVSGHNVYSSSNKLPISENFFCHPSSSYGLSKLLSEKILEYYSKKYNLKLIILRVSFTYGPHQKNTKMISKFIINLKNSRGIILEKFTNGYQKMDIIHVFDVCDAIISSLKLNKKISIYNIATGKTTTIHDIIKILKYNINSKSQIKIKSIQSKTNHFCYDISLAKKELNFKPKISLSQGLSHLVK